jgi:glycosyltransferase involved in cell wall biosynthesis
MIDMKLAPVSVIIPCFRCCRTIERAVASVAQQSQVPAELILVDDASGDGTWELLQSVSQRYPAGWIKLIQLNENVGAASARNAAWAIASQTYVAFLDSDDTWHPKKIEIQYAYMKANPGVVLSGHGFRRLKQHNMPDWPIATDIVAIGAKRISKWPLFLSNKFVTPSVMLRRDVAHRFVEKQRYMEDHMLWLKVICTGGHIVKLDADLAAIYKEPFGEAGLSAQVWLMERSDLGNYLRLFQKKHVNIFQFILLVILSSLKYVRRILIYWSHVRWQR